MNEKRDIKSIYNEIRRALWDFHVMHLTGYEPLRDGEPNVRAITDEEIDELLKRIDEARRSGGELEDTEREAKNLHLEALRSAGPVIPFIMMAPYLQRIEAALKKSAYADVIVAILACERYFANYDDDAERGKMIADYLEKLIASEESLAGMSGGDKNA